MNTATSSTDDLSATNQLSSSAFHSKDSALGLSDDNLNYLSTNQLLLMHDDDDDDERPQRLLSPSLLTVPSARQSKYLPRLGIKRFAALSRNIIDRTAHNDDAIRSNIDCVHLDYSASVIKERERRKKNLRSVGRVHFVARVVHDHFVYTHTHTHISIKGQIGCYADCVRVERRTREITAARERDP